MLHGARSYLMQDDDGQTIESHSISAGLDYPGVGPEHAWLRDTGRAEYRADHRRRGDGRPSSCCARTEGIIPAIESAHALAGAHAARRGARAGRVAPGQPLRSRRQGRRHCRPLVRADSDEGRATTASSERTSDASTVFAQCRAAEGRAALVGYLPGRVPRRRRGRSRPWWRWSRRRRHRRGRRALHRPGAWTAPSSRPPSTRRCRRAAGSRDVFAPSGRCARRGAPPLVMTYWNPIQRYGAEGSPRDLAEAGGAGSSLPTSSPRRPGRGSRPPTRHGLDPVFLVAPSATDERLASTAAAVPRVRLRRLAPWASPAPAPVSATRAAGWSARIQGRTDLPVCVGLGVCTREQAAEVAALRRRRHRRLRAGEVPDRG